jgi:dolichol-phosphate mannosyltransferase
LLSKDEVTVVLPTLNEEEAIGLVIDELKQMGYDNILVVDGYSQDNTPEIARRKGIKVVQQHGIGKSMAVKTAIEHVTTPFILVMDGDCTYDAEDIEKFLPHIKNYNEVIGARVNGKNNIPSLNRLGNWLITQTFNFLFGTKLADVCSGMYMLRSDFAKRLNLESGGFDIEVEIAAQAAREGGITQVPINYRKRVGKQKLRSWKHGFQIMTTVWNLARSYNPVFLFSIVSALIAIPAVSILFWVFLEWLMVGVWHSGWALFAAILIFLAAQAFTMSTVAVLLKRMEQRVMQRLKT